MNHLYCPWREHYCNDDGPTKQGDTTDSECVFCTQFATQADDANFIIKRYEYCIVMLNRYPYNPGHLLILPNAHLSDLTLLSKQARDELMEITTRSIEILRNHAGAHGANIGMNLGKIAGAGIPSHLHMHVVPRYTGDTNFMTTVAETKTISFDLKEILERLKAHF